MKMLTLCLAILLLGPTLSAGPIVVIVRHAEKANNGEDPDLSAAGRSRAEMLARMLKDVGISAIFTSEFKRTQETAAPTSTSSGVRPTIVPAKDVPALVSKLRVVKGSALVVGHGNTIPNLIKELGIQTPVNIPDEDYTEVFVVIGDDRPQLLRLHYP